MKKNILTISALALLIAGCGSDSKTPVAHSKAIKTLYQNNEGNNSQYPINYEDFAKDVKIHAKKVDGNLRVRVFNNVNVPEDIHHLQTYIDVDNDPSTGLTMGEAPYAIVGADYLVEDDALFKSTSKTEWEWDYVDTIRVRLDITKKPSSLLMAVEIPTNLLEGIDNNDENISVSIEPITASFDDANNYVPLSIVKLDQENSQDKVTRAELDEMIAYNDDYSKVDVSEITDMSKLFYGIDVNYDITNWDVSNVTNMSYMFGLKEYSKGSKSSNINQDLNGWDVSNVTDMSHMFYKARAFNQNIGDWNVSNVTNMGAMFSGARVFNQDIGNWNVSSVTDMWAMFESTPFNQNIGNWDVSSVTTMTYMFSSTPFNQNIGDWNVSSVTHMGAMFSGARAFNQDIGNWNVSSVTKMYQMFENTSDFNQDIGSWDVSSVTHIWSMFENATSFNQDLSDWNVTNIQNYENFSEGSPLEGAHTPNFTQY